MEWACVNCSFENAPSAVRCEICRSGRAPSAFFGSSKRVREAPRPPARGKKKSRSAVMASPVFKEDPRLMEKKLQQMRECLGDGVSEEDMKQLLTKNAGSVSFAIAAYFEQASRQETTIKNTNDESFWTRSMDRSLYYLGTATADASITRREEKSITVGARFLLQVEGTMVRVVSRTNNVVVGRLEEAWEDMLATLLNCQLLQIGGTIIEAPFETSVFARFQIQLYLFASPQFWTVLEESNNYTREKAFLLVEYLSSPKQSPSAALVLPGETFEKITDDTTVDVLYRTQISNADSIPGYSTDAIHSLLHNITLRSYQEQALQWMLFRETNQDALSDSHLIGKALRLDSASIDGKEAIHPLWTTRSCSRFGSPVPYYVNVFERLASLTTPLPPKPCRGGILADDMGMGKTIMIIALVAARKFLHRLPNATPRKGNTLVVCPLSLLHQWKQEFAARAPKLSVFLYYEQTKKLNVGAICEADVVITTYGVLSSEFEKNSMLHGITWDRVILDEAHSIKNRATAYFKSCAALEANHRWCLTGTPIQNSLEDILSLLVYLQYQPWDRTEWWNRVVAQPYEKGQQCALRRLQAILAPVLLRRTKATRDPLTQQLIVQLPPKHIEVVELDFSPEERRFYKAVYSKSRGEFYGYVESGNAMASYVAIFALLLRLRQACDHPFLVMGKADAAKLLENTRKKTILSSKHLNNEDYYSELTAIMQDSSASDQVKDDTNVYIKSRILEIQEEGLDCQECPVCLDVPNVPVLTPCAHLLCNDCARAALNAVAVCPVCRSDVVADQLIPITPPEAETPEQRASMGDMATSTKLRQLVSDLQRLQSEEPHRKVVVFSQWTHMLELVESTLSHNGYSHVRFDGSLRHDERERVLNEFNNGSTQVLVISLKAGGVGLNLTAASVVIILDPWWNPALEDQAVDRVHRLGQMHDVIVKKYKVKDTVEDMILQLQARKASMASTVLATAKAGADNDGRLSLSDLLKFFG